MSTITYTAKREIMSGHTAGTDYSLEFTPAALDRSAKTKRTEHRSLSGASEVLRLYHDRYWAVTTGYIDKADLDNWREWFHSVDGGETFTFDPDGTIASPISPITVMIDGDSYSERRASNLLFQVSFKVRF